MPLYEYECDSCGHRFEVIQKFSDPLVKVCPKCGCKVEKLLSSPAIQFKGSGFYINDYARKGKSDHESDKTSEKTSDKPAETAKAAATSDAKSSPSSSNSSASSGSTDTVSASSSSKQS